jgi:putative ABC transport system substrate-binding protein
MAQAPPKVPRVGVLDGWAPSAFPLRLAAFRDGLRDLGYIDGKSIVFEYRSANGRVAELPKLAAELVQLGVDVIFAGTTPAALAAREATHTIPVVIAVVADPVGVKLISSLARPGGNVTGLTTSNVVTEALTTGFTRRPSAAGDPERSPHMWPTSSLLMVSQPRELHI